MLIITSANTIVLAPASFVNMMPYSNIHEYVHCTVKKLLVLNPEPIVAKIRYGFEGLRHVHLGKERASQFTRRYRPSTVLCVREGGEGEGGTICERTLRQRLHS